MPYELFQRSSVRVELPTVAITPRGRIVVNAAGSRTLKQSGVKHVVLLWDRPNHTMALKAASKGEKNGFAVSFAAGSGGAVLSAKTFLRHIGWNAKNRENLPAVWNESEKMFEVALPPQCVSPAAGDPKRKTKRL